MSLCPLTLHPSNPSATLLSPSLHSFVRSFIFLIFCLSAFPFFSTWLYECFIFSFFFSWHLLFPGFFIFHFNMIYYRNVQRLAIWQSNSQSFIAMAYQRLFASQLEKFDCWLERGKLICRNSQKFSGTWEWSGEEQEEWGMGDYGSFGDKARRG